MIALELELALSAGTVVLLIGVGLTDPGVMLIFANGEGEDAFL